MDLSIIIINWNSAEYIKKCLSSLAENTKGIDFEIIVIDNGSFDSTGRMILEEFPEVCFLQSNVNLGFAKANNFCVERARGEFLLFLNPDTEIVGNAVAEMLSAIKSLPRAGIVGCKLLNTDKTLQTSCTQPFPTIVNQVLTADALLRLFSRVSIWGARQLFLNRTGPTEVQAIAGACMLIKKTVFEDAGRFSPEYFMYTEDIDLCYKVRRAGYINYYTGAASVIHHGGGSSHQREENAYANIQMRESIFKFLKKTRGNLYAGVYKKAMLLNGVMRFGILSFAFAASLLIGQGSKYKRSLAKWKGIIRWTLGSEKWAH